MSASSEPVLVTLERLREQGLRRSRYNLASPYGHLSSRAAAERAIRLAKLPGTWEALLAKETEQ